MMGAGREGDDQLGTKKSQQRERPGCNGIPRPKIGYWQESSLVLEGWRSSWTGRTQYYSNHMASDVGWLNFRPSNPRRLVHTQ